MRTLLFILLLSLFQNAVAQNNLDIVPAPAEIKINTGNLIIDRNTVIAAEHIPHLRQCAILLKNYLERKYNLILPIADISGTRKRKAIIIQALHHNNAVANESYEIALDKNLVLLSANSPRGIFYSYQTFIQLLPVKTNNSSTNNFHISLPQLYIKDQPRFQYRGMHLDVGRHFMPVEEIKKCIDYLALFKFNTFHWHLTEDQGWRIEIKRYPKLTQVGAWRNGTITGKYPGTGNDSAAYGGYYTQTQIKEVVQYAADRYISIIPEIEMPGHSSAAIASYPELSCFPEEDTRHPADCPWAGPIHGKQVQQTWGVFEDVFCPSEYTFTFLENVLDEVMTLFPSPYIHIGGDECPKEAWKRSAFCQQLIKEKGLKDEHELQSYFIQRIEKYVNSKGKKIIGWDEILEGGLAPNATVMSWRGEAGGIEAAKQNHDVIMTPGEWCYFDKTQSKNEDSVSSNSYLPIEKVYGYEPVPAQLDSAEATHVLGAQANVWTEYIGNPSKLEYMIFPRLAAMAEVLWTPKEKKDWKDFERRLPVLLERFDSDKVNYSRAYYDLAAKVIPAENNDGILWELKKRRDEDKIVYLTCIEDNRINEYENPIKISPLFHYSAAVQDASGEIRSYWLRQAFHFNKATGKKTTLSSPADDQYPGDGAFTLVNGVQSTAGFSRPSEYLGFYGKDCEALIDLGAANDLHTVTVHALDFTSDWIWKPAAVDVYLSADNINFASAGSSATFSRKENGTGTITVNFPAVKAQYIKLVVKNAGIIPQGHNGSGYNAWLFVDEIEAE